MKKLDERSHWENEWAFAFNDEKQTPSERVWQNIDSVLANKEAKKYKKRAFIYKWLAAASVFLSACGAVLFMLSSQHDASSPAGLANNSSVTEQQAGESEATSGNSGSSAEDQSAAGNTVIQEETSVAATGAVASGKGEAAEPEMADAGEVATKRNISGTANENGSIAGNESAVKRPVESFKAPVPQNEDMPVTGGPETEEEGSVNSFAYSFEEEKMSGNHSGKNAVAGISSGMSNDNAGNNQNNRFLNSPSGLPIVKAEKKGMVQEEQEPEIVEIYISKVWMPADLLKNKTQEEPERFWIGASVASNSFKPNFVDNSPAPVLMAQNSFKPDLKTRVSAANIQTWDKSQESIVSFAGGLQAAAHLSEKWVLQGGVQYGTYKTSGNAGAYSDASGGHTYPLHYSNFNVERVNSPANAIGSAGDFLSQTVLSSTPVSATNTFEFVSVPVTIGYIVLDRKFGIMVTPGVSSEFFLSNELSAEQDNLQDYKVKGSESPYNVVHFRGLLGAQLFYKLGESYVVSLEPSYQHAITDFNKSQSYFDSRPSNLSLGAAFRYIIR